MFIKDAKTILTEIYISADIKACIKKLDVNLAEDCLQYVFLELLQMDENFILDLNERGKLKHFIVKMLYNTMRFSRTRFKNELGYETPTETFADIEVEQYEEILVPLHKLYWYDSELLKLYAQYGTYDKVAELTGIPASSIFRTIKNAKKNIKKLI